MSLTGGQWTEIICQLPYSFEKLNTRGQNWTQKLRSNYGQQYYSVTLSCSPQWYILGWHKIEMGRSQLRITSPDPQDTQKRDRTEAIKKADNHTRTSDDVEIIFPAIRPSVRTRPTVMVYFDETEIHWALRLAEGINASMSKTKWPLLAKMELNIFRQGLLIPPVKGWTKSSTANGPWKLRAIPKPGVRCGIAFHFSEMGQSQNPYHGDVRPIF